MISITKTEEYVILKPESSDFSDAAASAMEKSVAGLYSSEGRIHYIIDLNDTTTLSESVVKLFDKIQKIAKREAGLLVTVVNNDSVMDVMADNSEFELLMLSSVDEAIEAVYMHVQDNEEEDEEEDEFGEENDY